MKKGTGCRSPKFYIDATLALVDATIFVGRCAEWWPGTTKPALTFLRETTSHNEKARSWWSWSLHTPRLVAHCCSIAVRNALLVGRSIIQDHRAKLTRHEPLLKRWVGAADNGVHQCKEPRGVRRDSNLLLRSLPLCRQGQGVDGGEK